MVLSPRLNAIANLIHADEVVVDIGSDHGQLPLTLLARFPDQPIYATEWRDGPYNRLKQVLKHTKVSIYQANGLLSLPANVTTVVMSGMGGITIESILRQLPEVPFRGKFILAPQSDLERVRLTLNEKGFSIVNEHIIFDRKYYWIIESVPGHQRLDDRALKYGPVFIKQPTEVFKRYVQNSIKQWRKRLLYPRLSPAARSTIEDILKELETLC